MLCQIGQNIDRAGGLWRLTHWTSFLRISETLAGILDLSFETYGSYKYYIYLLSINCLYSREPWTDPGWACRWL